MGTVNVLGRDLGLLGSLEQQIAALCQGEPVAVDLGHVDGRLFHSLSGMGFFSLMAREREYARRRFPFSRAAAFGMAATRSIFSPSHHRRHHGRHERTTSSRPMPCSSRSIRFDGAEWRRDRLDGGVFEVHVLNAGGLYSRSKAALSVAAGYWRSSSNLRSFTGDAVTLTRRDKRRGHVTFDGEVARKAGPLAYGLLPEP